MGVLDRFVLAFVLMALSLPLISYGASAGVAALWVGGLAMLAAGGLIPPAVRYTAADPDAL
ncbi:hypothetical protein [Halorubrum sp. 2020YC2]|uniref:hypothetical protein n=1 Tax=Halorubrum sp. 2020YC2 TaxID=2836432 RepID=UPI001BE7E6EB|nr:hypothetical protein [Halorubrum sp. 2020YC2]QWC18190.1 hypothetical protein KI388_08385 [Halorubrum sp. 2020YC2]